MGDSVNDPNSPVNEIFGESDDEFEFDGFHREELGRFSDAEVEEYDESKIDDQYFTLYLINTFSPLRNFH